jgi:general secretion pathway protein K
MPTNCCGPCSVCCKVEPVHMRSRCCTPSQTASDGFILVAVLWIIAALAILASIFSIYLANTAVSLSLNDGAIQSEALVLSSLELTAYQVSVPKAAAGLGARPDPNVPPPPTRGEFSFRLGRANVAVNFISEAARIDLNAASPQLVASFFEALGAQRQQAGEYADRIDGWITKPRPTSRLATADDSEEALYRAAGRSYSPRGGPFAHIDELSLVLNLPPALVERAKPFLTVYSGRPQIDVLDAAPEVLAAIPGLTPSLLDNLAEARKAGADQQSVERMLGALPIQGVVSVDGGDTYRVQVRIRYDNGRREASEVVILTGLTDKPYRVLWWRDGIDALSPSIQQPALQLR